VISMEQATQAKAELRTRLGRPAWLRGIGIGSGPDGSPVLQVNVAEATAEIRALVPGAVNGVPVRLEDVGDIERQEA